MYIKVLEKTSTPSHSLKEGDIVNIRAQDAQKLIDSKKASELTKKELEKFNKANKD